MLSVVCAILQLGVLAILAWIILSYVVAFGRIPYGHPVRRAYDVLARGIDPILRPVRAVIPPIRVGGAALDLSPLILILGVGLLRSFIC